MINVPVVSRSRKGALSSDGTAARLCHLASEHQRGHRYYHVVNYIPGPANVMADDASPLQDLTDKSHFQQTYLQPRPWQLRHLPPNSTCLLISALLSTSLASPSLPRPAKRKIGPMGMLMREQCKRFHLKLAHWNTVKSSGTSIVQLGSIASSFSVSYG